MNTKRFLTATLIATLIFLTYLPGFAYNGPIDLGTLGGCCGYAVKINDGGMVVGASNNANYDNHAVIWFNNTITDLGTLGGPSSWAADITNSGQVIGSSKTTEGYDHGFLWENGVITDLSTPGGDYSDAYDINDNGVIVGAGTVENAENWRWHALYWENGVMVDLGNFFDGDSWAYKINNRKQILGNYTTATGEYHGFIYQNGSITDLGYFEIFDLTNSGLALGMTINAAGEMMGVFWDGRQMIEMGNIEGALYWYPIGINNNGQIIGRYYDEQGSEHGFLWNKGVFTFLDFLPSGIDVAGQIIGYRWNPTSMTQEGLVWQNGNETALGNINGGSVTPGDIADNGTIVGQCLVDDYPHACAWMK